MYFGFGVPMLRYMVDNIRGQVSDLVGFLPVSEHLWFAAERTQKEMKNGFHLSNNR